MERAIRKKIIRILSDYEMDDFIVSQIADNIINELQVYGLLPHRCPASVFLYVGDEFPALAPTMRLQWSEVTNGPGLEIVPANSEKTKS